MPEVSPQLGISQTLSLAQADILTLNSEPFIVIPGASGFVNVFQSAMVNYRYKTAIFTNIDNLLSFKIVPTMGDPVVVSNSLGAENFLGIEQSTTLTFVPANPYTALFDSMDNAPLVFTIGDSDPIGGSVDSVVSIIITYAIFQLS